MATSAAVATQQTKPKPRLKNLDELFKLNEDHKEQVPETVTTEISQTSNEVQDTIFTTLPFSLMDDFKEHPFRLYEGERKKDMVESIKDKGILQPLILRPKQNDRYEILSGHNRKYCGIEAGLEGSPVIIKKNLSDEDAWIYVIETNLLQRSFSDMLESEKAAVLSLQHSKLFSQGKRNDIIAALKKLENPHDTSENSTSAEIRKSSNTRNALAEEYGLKPNQIALYLRVHQLIDPLKVRLDHNELPLSVAADLSFLKETEQKSLDKCLELNGFKADMKKTDILRGYSQKGKLNEENIFLILNGELGCPPKKKRAPTFRLKQKVYSQYFTPGQKASEIEEVIEKALEFYFSQNHNREQETASQESAAYLSADDADHDYDDEQAM
ncbi:ParB N-terminal domain-containing protein [Desulfosporosinus lacus]|uniref:Chromosome partitioning protein, ParB family n=1 Tax=Desulfosporosinus lacus DSM 15449 TaxID=1121420 RepID=A0A1M5UYI3_9FIRM|nr:ParB N-terminal domain-containing protein [Desulfosporosinus lacus]SHH68029.1 chromosome partitioning protein, ParB family [Desulfosporosinus lacus DSM 15449]